MLISSEITGIYLWRSSLNPATSSSTWCWFQTAVAIKQKTSDNFFDLAAVSGVFGKYAKKSKLVVGLGDSSLDIVPVIPAPQLAYPFLKASPRVLEICSIRSTSLRYR